MPRGRKPKPSKLKVFAGNPGKRKINEHEPVPANELPKCPAYLDAQARVFWNRIVGQCQAMGAALPDATALERMAMVYSRVRKCEAVLGKDGLTYERLTKNGTIIANRPEVAVLAAAERELRALLVEFGLTPSSRCRIDLDKLGAAKPQGVSAFARKRG